MNFPKRSRLLQIRLIRAMGLLVVMVFISELVTLMSGSKVLSGREALTGLTYANLIKNIIVVEGIVGVSTVLYPELRITAWIAGWLGISLAGYRLARLAMGLKGPCKCLGQLMAWWPWGERNENILSWIIIIIIITVSGYSIFFPVEQSSLE